tara:strand:+ start:926 stop:1483 length:558 start_codon:yes stop_codon:yes gene_type:complete
MRVTKSQIKQIIKEELELVLEQSYKDELESAFKKGGDPVGDMMKQLQGDETALAPESDDPIAQLRKRLKSGELESAVKSAKPSRAERRAARRAARKKARLARRKARAERRAARLAAKKKKEGAVDVATGVDLGKKPATRVKEFDPSGELTAKRVARDIAADMTGPALKDLDPSPISKKFAKDRPR